MLYTMAASRIWVLFVSLSGLLVWFLWIRRHPDQWGYAVPPLTWLLHVSAFYLVLLSRVWWGDDISLVNNFEMWSIIVKLHAAFLTAGIGLVMYFERIIVVPHAAQQ